MQSRNPLQDLSEVITRSEAAFKLFRDFPASGLSELLGASLKRLSELQGLSDSRSFGAMDLYDRPMSEVKKLNEVKKLLAKQGILDVIISFKKVNPAYSPDNFRNTAWTINSGESVTLLHDGDRVVGIQKGIQRSPNPDGS